MRKIDREFREVVKVSKLLLMWHRRRAKKILTQKAKGPDYSIERHIYYYLFYLTKVGKMDLGAPRWLYVLGSWQVAGPLEIFYQSRLSEELKPSEIDRMPEFIRHRNLSFGEIGQILRSAGASYAEDGWDPYKDIQLKEDNDFANLDPDAEPDLSPPILETTGGNPRKIEPVATYDSFRNYDAHMDHGIGGGRVISEINDDVSSRAKDSPWSPEAFGFIDATREEGIVQDVLVGRVAITEVILGAPGTNLGVLIRVQNTNGGQARVKIPAGTVFEVADPDSRAQNVVLAESKVAVIAHGAETEVKAQGRCLNSGRATPRDVKGRLTRFRYTGEDLSQNAIWNRMENPV